MQKKYSVTGMTCSACSAHVEKAVRGVAGVQEVTVNLLGNSMTVKGDALDDAVICHAVDAAGYGAAPQGGSAAAKAPQEDPMQAQLKNMKFRLIVSFAFLVPLMYISMGSMWGAPQPAFITGMENAVAFAMMQFLLCLPVVYVNRQYYINGFKALWHRAPTMDSLIAIGSAASLAYGVFAIMRMGHGLGVQDMELVHRYHMDLYFEGAAMILALITLGKFLETRSKGKTGAAIAKLMDLAPKTATLVRDGVEVEVPIEEVRIGDTLSVRPGQSIPVDGVVLGGTTTVDEAALTGESMPVEKTTDSTVLSASVNLTGHFTMRATKVGEDTTLAQIIHLVEDANSTKAPIAKMADKIAGVFVPVVMGIALLATIVWLVLGQTPEFAISIGISVLVISCPCALGLATPVAIMVGTGKGAENGILIKSGEALEAAHSVQTVVLDKTGTITQGKPVVTDVLPMQGQSEDALLQLAASLEHGSEHPLAGAIMNAAKEQNVQLLPVTEFKAVFGRGVQGKAENHLYFAGNAAMMEENHIPLTEAQQQSLATLADDGKTPLLFADETAVQGIIAVADVVKPTSREALAELTKMGIEVVMLTGDNERTANAIKRQLDIPRVIAGVLPQQKEQEISALQQQGKVVAMVGDGINDAPALARANVGIAIGAGADVALESADIVLMKNDLLDVVTAIRLSKAVLRNIKENLFWAFFYNSLGIPLAAGVFYAALNWKLNPMFAAAAMSLSSVCVVSNALRLRSFKASGHKTAQPQAEVPQAAAATETTEIANINTNIKEEKEETTMKNYTMKIDGMMCMNCRAHVDKALNGIEGVTATVDLENKCATVSAPESVTPEMLTKAVADAGYTVTEIA